MDRINPFLKWTLIAFLVVVITILHYSTLGGHADLHIIYGELYFLPILLSCIWFGLYQGLGTAVVIGIIYVPHVFIYSDTHGLPAIVSVQILVFVAIAAVLGVLVERQRRQQQQAADTERLEVLGRAASIVGEEINSSLSILRGALDRLDAPETVVTPLYAQELDRLHEIAEVLITFRPSKADEKGPRDLNHTVRTLARRLADLGRKKGVRVLFEFDRDPCRADFAPERFTRLLEDLVKNAVEVSRRGQRVWVRLQHEPEHCLLSVTDEGPGIREEHLPRIFSPFFTTKPDGHGLALAASRKYLREIGGDILVENEPEKGAQFTIQIPREDLKGLLNGSA
ncbi:MAG: ATP-binding protein [Desulfobacterales bacterium]